MRLAVSIFGRDLIAVDFTLDSPDDEDPDPRPFGFAAGATLITERLPEPFDEEA